MRVSTFRAIINPFRVGANACLKLQEVAYKARRAEKLLVLFPATKGLDLLSLHKRLVTAKLTGAGPNVTILKLLHPASIGKVDGLTGLAGTADNEQIAQTIRAVGNVVGLRSGFCPASAAIE
jgi:hypothetical protein